jgi:poly-gamma-glutamate synthesis protein (capsule biosynthesis protein)
MPSETAAVTETSYTSDETSMQEAEISEPDDGEYVTVNQASDEIISETSGTAVSESDVWQTVSFSAVGDNLIHKSIYTQAAARSSDGGYDFAYAYENVADLINTADVAVINQETLICNDLFEPSTYPFFNSPTALGDYMIDFGFDVFTMANNHTLDKGVSGLEACLDYWDTKDVVVAGAYRNEADKENIRTFESGGVKFSVLSYTESLNGLSLPQGSELIIGDAYDIDGMKSDIEKAKEISDVCIVALHWGVENSDVISDYQRTTAKILADAGADIIIGNHPHVLRDIEMITRDDGTSALCAYSLGNFISAQSVGQNLIGGVLQFNVSVCISDTEDEESPVISDVKLIPIVTQYEGEYQNVRLYKFSDYTPELASSHGVNTMSTFGYDYIKSVLEKNINEEYLVM